MNSDCVFCKIVSGKIPVKFEYEDDEVVVFNSNAPLAEHHLLVVPKKHISAFKDLDHGNEKLILKMVLAANKMINEKDLLTGYRLIINGGKYQEVPHLHMHLLGGKFKHEDEGLNEE